MEMRKPSWWQLFILAPIILLSTVLVHFMRLPGPWEQISDGSVVVLAFAAILVWLQVNGELLEQYEMERDEIGHTLKITVYDPNSEKKKNRALSHGPRYLESPRPSVRSRRGPSADPGHEEDQWRLN